MLSFLKVFLRGIICTVLLPFILLIWVIYGVYCLIAFFVMLIKSIILFFAGDNAAGELKEDIEAKRIILEAEQNQLQQTQAMNMFYQNAVNQQPMYGQQTMQQPLMPQQPNFAQQTTLEKPSFEQTNPQQSFDPFIPDDVPEKPLPTEESNIEERAVNNDESY